MAWSKKINYLIFLLLFFLYFLIKNLQNSVFLNEKERVNVVFYSDNPLVFSLARNDLNYIIKFSNNIKILVPGGYGYYRIGALGKLVFLEKNPDIFRKTFSSATSSFVNLYFYPRKAEVYYSSSQKIFPELSFVFFSRSNANFIDRLILFFHLINKDQKKFKLITFLPSFRKNNDLFFDREEFFQKYQGIFYKKSNRQNVLTCQIFYQKSYSTSFLISNIIDGEGIKVVDISKDDKNDYQKCQIITKDKKLISKTFEKFFDCQIKIGNPEISDIIIKLGDLEKSWSVN